MVKQRFLTHFKPWLFAVTKVGGLIVGYQLVDRTRMRLQYAPLNIVDVVMASIFALLGITLFCGLWAWGEWCRFKLRNLHALLGELKSAHMV